MSYEHMTSADAVMAAAEERGVYAHGEAAFDTDNRPVDSVSMAIHRAADGTLTYAADFAENHDMTVMFTGETAMAASVLRGDYDPTCDFDEEWIEGYSETEVAVEADQDELWRSRVAVGGYTPIVMSNAIGVIPDNDQDSPEYVEIDGEMAEGLAERFSETEIMDAAGAAVAALATHRQLEESAAA